MCDNFGEIEQIQFSNMVLEILIKPDVPNWKPMMLHSSTLLFTVSHIKI